MKKFYTRPLLTAFLLLTIATLWLQTPWAEEGVAQTIIDGDTFTINHKTIRLLGINTPEKAHGNKPAEEGAAEASLFLKNLLLPEKMGVGVTRPILHLKEDTRPTDQYGRTLAHVYLADGTWVNKALIAAGVAHVYSFPDNRAHLKPLLQAEKAARQAKKGLWATKRWQVLQAENIPPTAIGQYRLVQGTPRALVVTEHKLYLNFGENWRTDFTVEVPKKFLSLFKEEGVDLNTLIGKKIEVRGHLKPVNGVLITATHPEQLAW